MTSESAGYLFRREDNGRIESLSFLEMMAMDAAGFVTLADGVQARRCRTAETIIAVDKQEARKELEKPILSDSLGFCANQLADFEADRVKHGFTGVEFVREPGLPEFIQVKISSAAEWARYVKHRGMCDRNSRNGGGVAFTPEQMEDAKQRILQKYPVAVLTPAEQPA